MVENDVAAAEPRPSESQHQIQTPPSSQAASRSIEPPLPSNTSLDAGSVKRPRDARLIHMILANLGVNGYQERVPLQLMDFAYRYTSSVIQDALHLTSEAYASTGITAGKTNHDVTAISPLSLRLTIESRTHYQFSPSLPKEHYMELAAEKNKIALPALGKDVGLRLPPERYCLTGVGWALKEEWESDGEAAAVENEDLSMADGEEPAEDEDEQGGERMEDLFGETEAAEDEDKEMDEG